MIEKYKQFRIIEGRSADDLTERLNAALRDLRDKTPRVEFDGLLARVEYEETEEHIGIEGGDGRKKKSLALVCGDCPMFEPLRRMDGEIDRRAKRGACPLSPVMGMTNRDSLVCDRFVDLFENGAFRIIKAEAGNAEEGSER